MTSHNVPFNVYMKWNVYEIHTMSSCDYYYYLTVSFTTASRYFMSFRALEMAGESLSPLIPAFTHTEST